jgi:hypothetical protein
MAPVELMNIDPATITATTGLNRILAILFSPTRRIIPISELP